MGWGMHLATGQHVLGERRNGGLLIPSFLGKELAEEKDYSEHTARFIDEEIKKIAVGMEAKVQEALNHNIPVLDALAAALLAHETLSRKQIDEVLEKAGMAAN
jgi:cell division protease FtsH